MRSTAEQFQQLAARTGSGDQLAFRRLYGLLAPVTLVGAYAGIADDTQALHAVHVVRGTFCEVWRLCAFDVRCGEAHPVDIPDWIAGIARRRTYERRQALDLITASPPHRDFWTDFIADQDQVAHAELLSLLGSYRPMTRAGKPTTASPRRAPRW